MDQIPSSAIAIALAFLIVLSGFFSSSETSLMSLNRYRLRHLARQKHKGARRAQDLLNEPDRLIGLILLGNNFVNILASALATILAVQIWGEKGVLIATAALTVIVLIFAEVAPKTVAALYPEKIAFPASFILKPLLRVSYPVVYLINAVANTLLLLVGVRVDRNLTEHLTVAELRTLVSESGKIQARHQHMLINLIDLEQATVSDVMVPRNEIVGLDLEDEWDLIVRKISSSYYTRLLVYETDINNVLGILHVRSIIPRLARNEMSKEGLRKSIRKPYFIPESAPLTRQLLEFQQQERRMALVVNEYGDVEGLVTVDDILAEIVGDYAREGTMTSRDIVEKEGSYQADGSASIRSLNRRMGWSLPTTDARTLNGLLLEQLESIPTTDTSVRFGDLALTITRVKDNQVKTVKIEYIKGTEAEEEDD